MGTQFRNIGTTVLAAATAIALSGTAAFAQGTTDATPAPSFHVADNLTFDPGASTSLDLAQSSHSSHHEGLGFGIKGGFIFKSLEQSPINGAPLGNKTGQTIGIFFGGNRPGRVGVQGELLYNTRKGIEPNNDTLSIHSLEIPVLLRVNIGSQSLKGVLVYILAGEANDIQLSAGLTSGSLTKNYKGLNIDAIFGGGIEITRFFIEGREDIGMFSVNSGDLGSTSRLNTKSFELLFGLRIN